MIVQVLNRTWHLFMLKSQAVLEHEVTIFMLFQYSFKDL